ncbi:MAG: N-acetylmuramoyl-L-alanine amidase [Alistipes sp.]
MRAILFTIVLFFATTLPSNGVAAENIAHGVKVVVIDAGHGGRFPGAHYAGITEKNLTLSVALELGRLIEENMPGVQVVYTRKTDKELDANLATDLQKRADIANKANGDLFISIHVNAARSSAARGVETLIMGESSKEQRYNNDALFENNREDLIDMSDEKTAAIVRAYIQNLQFTYGEYSMAIARCIQQQYVKAGRHDRGIKPQLLRVLYATDMPCVLTEIGFMSNADEAAYLRSERGQNEIARTLFDAVKNYARYIQGMREADEPIATQVPDKQPVEDTSVKEPVKVTPQPVKQPEQVTSQPAKQPENGSAMQREQAEGYAVQVLASPEQVPLNSTRFKEYNGEVKQYIADGRYCYKYCVGFRAERSDAQSLLPEIRRTFPDAFVVHCVNGKIVK